MHVAISFRERLGFSYFFTWSTRKRFIYCLQEAYEVKFFWNITALQFPFLFTGNEFKNVEFCFRGNLTDTSADRLQEMLQEAIAAVVEDNAIIKQSKQNSLTSFSVVLSMREECIKKLIAIEQQDREKLGRLNIEYFVAGFVTVYIECSTGNYKSMYIFIYWNWTNNKKHIVLWTYFKWPVVVWQNCHRERSIQSFSNFFWSGLSVTGFICPQGTKYFSM